MSGSAGGRDALVPGSRPPEEARELTLLISKSLLKLCTKLQRMICPDDEARGESGREPPERRGEEMRRAPAFGRERTLGERDESGSGVNLKMGRRRGMGEMKEACV